MVRKLERSSAKGLEQVRTDQVQWAWGTDREERGTGWVWGSRQGPWELEGGGKECGFYQMPGQSLHGFRR